MQTSIRAILMLAFISIPAFSDKGGHGGTQSDGSIITEMFGVQRPSNDFETLKEYLMNNAKPIGFISDSIRLTQQALKLSQNPMTYRAALDWVGSFLYTAIVDLGLNQEEILKLAVDYRNIKQQLSYGMKSDALWESTKTLIEDTDKVYDLVLAELNEVRVSGKQAVKVGQKKIVVLEKTIAHLESLLKAEGNLKEKFHKSNSDLNYDIMELRQEVADLKSKGVVFETDNQDLVELRKDIKKAQRSANVDRARMQKLLNRQTALEDSMKRAKAKAHELAEEIVSPLNTPEDKAQDIEDAAGSYEKKLSKPFKWKLEGNRFSQQWHALTTWMSSDDVADLSAKEARWNRYYQQNINEIRAREATTEAEKRAAKLAEAYALEKYTAGMKGDIKQQISDAKKELDNTKQAISDAKKAVSKAKSDRSKIGDSF